MLYTNQQKEVTEITVGSAFYAPALFDQFTHLQLEKAAGFALSVTRKPEKILLFVMVVVIRLLEQLGWIAYLYSMNLAILHTLA